MFYVKDVEYGDINLYGVEDTKDDVVEYYDSATLKSFVDNGVKIEGYLRDDLIVPVVKKSNSMCIYVGESNKHDCDKVYMYCENKKVVGRRNTIHVACLDATYFYLDRDKKDYKTYKDDLIGFEGRRWLSASTRNYVGCDNFILNGFAEFHAYGLRYARGIEEQCEPLMHVSIPNGSRYIEVTFSSFVDSIKKDFMQDYAEYPVLVDGKRNGDIILSYNVLYDTSLYVKALDKGYTFKVAELRELYKKVVKGVSAYDANNFSSVEFQVSADFVKLFRSFGYTYRLTDGRIENKRYLYLSRKISPTGISYTCIDSNGHIIKRTLEDIYSFALEHPDADYMVSADGDGNCAIDCLSGVDYYNMEAVNIYYGRCSGGGDKKDAVSRKLLGKGVFDIWKNGELHDVKAGKNGIIEVPSSCSKVADESIDLNGEVGIVVGDNIKAWSSKAFYYDKNETAFVQVAAVATNFRFKFVNTSYKVASRVVKSLESFLKDYWGNNDFIFELSTEEDVTTAILCGLRCKTVNIKDSNGLVIGGTDFTNHLSNKGIDNAIAYYIRDELKGFSFFGKGLELKSGSAGVKIREVCINESDELTNYNALWRCTSWALYHSYFRRLAKFYKKLRVYLDSDRRIYWDTVLNAAYKKFNDNARVICHKFMLLAYDYDIPDDTLI